MRDSIDQAWYRLIDELVNEEMVMGRECGYELGLLMIEGARELALGVLERAVSKVTHDNDEGAFECDTCAWGIQELRAEIEALR